MPEILTKTEYAARRDVEPSAVSHWISRGKLRAEALTDDGRIVAAVADAQLAESVDPGRGNPTAMMAKAGDREPAAQTVSTMPAPGSLADIRLRTETLRLAELERQAAIARGELIYAAQAERAWGAALEDELAAIEQFILELPSKLGLDRDAAMTVRGEWRAFRERRADQAAELMEQPRAA